MGRKIKLHYTKGFCDIPEGRIYFLGGISGVSNAQARYYLVQKLKLLYPQINYWIDPCFEICRTLPSTHNYLRNGLASDFKHEFVSKDNVTSINPLDRLLPKCKILTLSTKKKDAEPSNVQNNTLEDNVITEDVCNLEYQEELLRQTQGSIKSMEEVFKIHFLVVKKLSSDIASQHSNIDKVAEIRKSLDEYNALFMEDMKKYTEDQIKLNKCKEDIRLIKEGKEPIHKLIIEYKETGQFFGFDFSIDEAVLE